MKKIIWTISIFAIVALLPSCYEEDEIDNIKNVYSDSLDEHEYVDLGLPSGTLWATTNVGAADPFGYGAYYAWGETEIKNSFEWGNYKHMRVGESTWEGINKYNVNDGLKNLSADDDAATANWGKDWKTPTAEQWIELRKECMWRWTSSYNMSHVSGYIVMNPQNNDIHIFLPAAGYCIDSRLRYAGEYGSYWSSTVRNGKIYDAGDLCFMKNNIGKNTDLRYYGYTIRPVRAK